MPNTLSVNFKGVEPATGRRTDHVPDDTYQLRVSEVSKAGNKSKNGKRMPVVSFTVNRGEYKGKRLMENFVIEGEGDEIPFGLSRLLALLEACKIKVPRSSVKLDLDSLLDRTCYGEVYTEEYNGRPQSKIGAFMASPKPAGGRRAEPDEDEDDEEDVDEDEDEEDEAEEEDEEEEEAPAPRRKAKVAAKAAPAAKAKAKAKAPARKAKRAAADDDDDEEDEDEEEDEDFDFE